MRFPTGGRHEDHLGWPPHAANHPQGPAPHATAARRKGTAIRAWAVVSASGPTRLEELGKHTIMRRTGLPARDLRVLDPALSYPSTILGRERAIVVNLEHVKAIITATEVLIPKSNQPILAPFIQDLQCRVSAPPYGPPQQATANTGMDGEAMPKATWGSPSLHVSNGSAGPGAAVHHQHHDPLPEHTSSHNVQGGSPGSTLDGPKGGSTKALPFEFRALEVCLDSACRCLEAETLGLEQEAYPALDELTSKISTLNLERVRLIKNRLVTISGRVQKVRDELEHLLDDDMDMAEMYLTEKLVQLVGESSLRVDLENDPSDSDDGRDEQSRHETGSNMGSLAGFKPDIEELEMLLEAYFVQIDATLNKLSTLREYVDDTEDYINIMLDDKQNQLLEMGVMLSTATLVFSAGIVVVGIFGMNIHIGLYDESTPYSKFWETTFGTIGGCAILYVLAIGWGKKRGLLQ
uniref:Magnesium transporter n=1 Tax=Anthurium amnicola TaxID=1678845 RepID=A0A1D1XTU8_9ARAE